MRKVFLCIVNISIMLLLIFASGCSKADGQPQGSVNQQAQSKSAEKKLIVYASIYPMYDFTKNIGKDKIELKQMLPPGTEPHAWEPTAKLIAEMEKADVFIYNGAGMEPWVEKLIKSIKNQKIVIVDASKGIELLKLEGHNENEYGRGSSDPHIWLDPVNASKQAELIKDVLASCDEPNKEFYDKNYEDFADRLMNLDKGYKEGLRGSKRKEIVVAHAAFGYLCKRYGLEQISVRGVSADEEPNAARMSEITNLLKDGNVKYVFFETLTNPKLSQVLAKEVGAQTAVLNPVDGLTEEDVKSGKDYISAMEENLAVLKRALGE